MIKTIMILDEKQTEKWKSIEEQNQNIGHELNKIISTKMISIMEKITAIATI